MNTTLQSYKDSIAKFLLDRSITFEALYNGQFTEESTLADKKGWSYNGYVIKFTRKSTPNAYLIVDYKMGLGLSGAPEPADVLYSLISDMDVTNYDKFEDWANDLGYDTDSRKAEATYLACWKIAKEMKAIFTESELVELRELLQDY